MAFEDSGGGRCLKDAFRSDVDFHNQDLIRESPAGPFDLILCRNLAFTYFDERLQRETAQRLSDRLRPGGVLMVGWRESVPDPDGGLLPMRDCRGLYQRRR